MPAGPEQPSVQGRPPQHGLGVGLHLHLDLAGQAVRGIRDRRVCLAHCGLAGKQLNAHRLLARRNRASLVQLAATRREARNHRLNLNQAGSEIPKTIYL